MSAKNLIKLASEKGYQVSKLCKGIYQYHYSNKGTWTVKNFEGSYSEFVKFVKSLEAVA